MNYAIPLPSSGLLFAKALCCNLRSRLTYALALIAVSGLTELQAATIIYVNKNAPATSATNGTSWANAYVELRAALASTTVAQATEQNPVEIWVAKGTYTPVVIPTGQTNLFGYRLAAFSLVSHLRILGGFKGTETSDTQRPFFGYPTVLSGDIGIPQANRVNDQNAESGALIPMNVNDPGFQDNSFNVLVGVGVTDVVLDKLVIAGGFGFNSTTTDDYIKGMVQQLDDPASTSIKGETIVPLDRTVCGGGLFFRNSHDRATNGFDIFINTCTFMNNGALGYGGAAAFNEANVEVVGSTFKNNVAGEQGGACFLQSCTFNFFQCDFETNHCDGAGGALEIETLSSDKTIPPSASEDEFEKTYGVSKKNFQQYTGWAITAGRIVPAFVSNYRILYTPGAGAWANLRRSFQKTLPTNPATGYKVSPTSRAAGAYAYLSGAVAAVDMGVMIAEAAGANTNDTFIAGWSVFSEGFNKWATPQGYITMLLDYLKDKFPDVQFLDFETLTQQALQVRGFQVNVYNQASSSSVLLCNFKDNFAGSQGGAVDCVYENVQFEACTFTRNIGNDNGGALALSTWTTPRVISCIFYKNVSTNGHSAIFSYEHARAQIVNCTIYQNHSHDTNGFAVGTEKGSETKIFNSILWGNTNPTNSTGGADIFTATKALLAADTNALAQYNAAGPAYGDWIGICDIANSCVQSLHQMPVGTDNVQLFDPGHYSQAQIDETLRVHAAAVEDGTAGTYHFFNLGEGNRPTMLEASRGNTDADPILDSNLVPSHFSPVIDAGSNKKVQNVINHTLTGVDVLKQDRFVGGSVDMGAVENQGGFSLGDIIYVRPTATGNGSGSSWANATADLQAAMSHTGQHQVWVAAGTYRPTSGTDRNVSFSIANQVSVFGGFAGTETNITQRNWQANPSILSGDIGVAGNDSDNSYHVFYNAGIDSRTLLDGFTITKGRAGDYGGGIRNINASPTIQNCKFIDNAAQFDGGAIYSTGLEGSPINFCQFSNNVATTGDGGAICYSGSRLYLEECSFQKNSAATGGGAILVINSDVAYIYNSLFVSNSVSGGSTATGGAVKGQDADMRLYNCTFYGNSLVSAGNANGGGAFNYSSYTRSYGPNAQNCIFWHNTATNTSGAQPSLERRQISLVSATPYFTYSIIEGLDTFAGEISSANLDIDPQFVNPAGGNFRLTNSSPAIDAGRDNRGYGYPLVDLDRQLRFKNSSMDLGAYEFQGIPTKLATAVSLTKICDELGGIYSVQLVGTNPLATTYQWEVNKNDGAGFVSVANNSIYSGATTTNLVIIHPPLSYTGYRYRVRGSAQGINFTSSSATLKVSRAVLYVKANAAGANDGTTWANAFTDLQRALAIAAPCSQIWVASGMYYPSTTDTSIAFQMKPDVGIYGGFVGTETNLAQRNWRVNVTTLSGNIGGGNNRNIVYNNGNAAGFATGPSAILDGFTLIGATNGAIMNVHARPTIRNCAFTDNYSQNGGAIYNSDGSSPLISACVFTRNTASLTGGAIYNSDSSPQVVNCVFYGNRSQHRGGAIGSSRSMMQLQNCTLFGNTSLSYGGGIWGYAGTNNIFNSILWGNKAGDAYGTTAGAQTYFDTSAGGGQSVLSSCWQGATNGSLAFDPLFVDTAAANLRLSPTSPLINGGNNAYTNGIITDADGNARVFGSAVDIGAFELQTAPLSSLYLVSAPQSITTCDTSLRQNFSVIATNSGTNFQWQLNSGSGFAPVPFGGNYIVTVSSNTSTLTVSNITASMNGYQFRVVQISSGLATPPATLTVSTPTILYVKAGQISGSHNGSSWANAFTNLQDALLVADTCNEIWVARGSYSATSNAGVYAFCMKSGVGIYGGFFGNETMRSQRNWTNNICLLSAHTNASAVIENNGYYGSAIDGSAILDGFTFTNVTKFAAIKNSLASPTIRNCRFVNNSGYGIVNDSAATAIIACTFSNNLASGIYNRKGAVQISSCMFRQNQSSRPGIGVYNEGTISIIDDCTFTDNVSGWGSVFNTDSGAVTLSRCVFRNNSSGNGGGALFNGGNSTMTAKNSLCDANFSATFRGGAISHYGASLTVVNCTLANNYASISGAGIYNQGSNVQIRNSIFWGNYLTGVWSASSAEEVQIDDYQHTVSIFSSDVQGLASFVGNGNIGYDPLFTNSAAGDFRLSSFSPAINAGTNDMLDAIDLVGNSRVFGASVDMGAYELQSAGAPALLFLSSPQPQGTCVGKTALFSVVGAPAQNYAYQWQKFDGANFVNVGNGGDISIIGGTNSSTLQLANLPLSLDGALFRLAISNTAFVSPSFSLNVYPPQIIYVRTNLSNGNGTSWTTAFNNVKDAIAAADACSEIWVARGTYFSSNAVSMKNGLRIYGGFVGTETQRDQRNWTNNPAILSAVTTEPVFYNLGNSNPIDTSTVLDGLTISGLSINAVVNLVASPSFQNCTFANNAGTAVLNTERASPIFNNCIFSNNLDCALASIPRCSPVVSNSLFINNRSSFRGAAIFNSSGSLQVSDCRFIGNVCTADGGGALCQSGVGQATVTRCVFSTNSANNGGAILFLDSTGSVADCLFSDNSSSFRGGAVSQLGSIVTLNNSTFVRNSAAAQAGGYYLIEGTLGATNSIFWFNADHDTFGGTVESAQVFKFSGTANLANCSVQGLNQFAGNNNSPYDPLFANPPANNFTLNLLSPAINTGNNAATGQSATDLAGNPRVFGAVVDLGAYEVQTPTNSAPLLLLSEPLSQTTCAGNAASFTVMGASNSSLSLTWQVNSNGSFQSISGVANHLVVGNGNTSTLIVSNTTTAMNGYQYRFLSGGYTSVPVTLTVTAREVIYVNVVNPNTNQTGFTWANAFTNLHDALAVADSCSEIWVAQGTYVVTPYLGANSFRLTRGAQVYGGFVGTEINRSQRNWISHATVLFGNGQGNVILNDGYTDPFDSTTVLDGFTITSTNSWSGIWNFFASPTIRNCRFENNGDAALMNTAGSPLVDNCSFTSNHYVSIDLRNGSTATITNCVFFGNMTFGANIEIDGASPLILNCRFFNNTNANNTCGVVARNGATFSIVNCIFTNNFGGDGAAGSVVDSSGNFINCLFANNNATHRAGGIASFRANVRFINCTIAQNSGNDWAVGISIGDGTNTFLNSILWNNVDGDNAPTPTSQQIHLENAAAVVQLSNSCLQGLTVSSNGNIGYNPLFADAASGNFRLATNSPAINAGSNSFAAASIDLDGAARVQLTTVDMGAYEAAVATTPLKISGSPGSQVHCPGDVVTFTFALTNSGALKWLWDTGNGWANFSVSGNQLFGPALGTYFQSTNATSISLIVSNTVVGMNGYRFHLVDSGGGFLAAPVTLHIDNSATIFVSAAAVAGGDGTSWATAYNNLQTALAKANSCRPNIWLAKGIYYPTATTNRSLAFQLKPNTAIYGGFAGTESTLNQRNWTANPTILSGDIGLPGATSDNSSAVVSSSGQSVGMDTNTILDGVIVENGGIGISVSQASPAIRNCIVRSNSNSGFLLNSASPLIENCSMLWNVGNFGGGLASYSGNPRIQNCIVSGNLSSNSGGGLYFQAGLPIVANSLVSGNKAITGGGIGYATPGTLQVIHCTIVGNSASYTSGGGIYGSQLTCTIEDTILWGNSSAGSSVQKSQFDFTLASASTHNCIQGLDIATALSIASTTNNPVFAAPKLPSEAPVVGGDYRLQPCSPLINSAYQFSNPGSLVGLDGQPRFVGNADVGAYEYQGAAQTPLIITTEPQSQAFCASGGTVMSVTAPGSGLSYQWQADFHDGNGFVSLIDDVVFSGTTTSSLLITNANSSFHQSQYRCVVVSSEGCSLPSAPATLTIQPSRLYVNASAPAGGNGLSWATAYQRLEQALLSSNLDICGSEIWVAAGTYAPRNSPGGAYHMTNHVAIYGGFAGGETALYERNWKTNLTILDGKSTTYIFYNSAPIDNSARLDGFVLRDGFHAIYNQYDTIGIRPGASPTIANCVFIKNYSSVLNFSLPGLPSTPVIQDCLFIDNGVDLLDSISGIGNSDADPLIQRCEFRGNHSRGGLISCLGSRAKIYDCLISGNTVGLGTIRVGGTNTTADIRNCTIVGNRATPISAFGAFATAGIYFHNGGGGEVANCIIWSNAIPNASPPIDAQILGSATVYNSDIFGWTASGNGNVAIDPLFAQTISAADAPTISGNFHLAPCSPVLNAGNNSRVGSDLLDLENEPRIFGSAVDLGAYEAQWPVLAWAAQPTDQFGSATNGVQFVAAPNQDNVSAQWQINRGSGFVTLTNDVNHSGAGTPFLTVSNLTPALNNYQYRCFIQTVGGCSLISQTGTLHYIFGAGVPTVSGNQHISVPESFVGTLATYTATNPDTNSFTWSLGGADAERFQIDASGNLSFMLPPDASAPGDSNGDNVYNMLVIATDPFGHTGSLAVAVTVLVDPGKPYFVTTPINNGAIGALYSYSFKAVSPGGSNLVYSAPTLPAWLTLVTNTYFVSTFAGGTFGTANGTGTNAQFVAPFGLALDQAGNLFVADKNNGNDSSIRKISPAGVVTKINSLGTVDIVVDSQTNLYVADLFRSLVLRLTAAGASNNLFSASFPNSVAIDSASNVYFTTLLTHAIYKFIPGSGISVLAGSTNTSGFANGNGEAARFTYPRGLAVAADGTVFVADTQNQRIRKITSNGDVTTFAGNGFNTYQDGDGSQASFAYPQDCALDASGNVYVVESGNRRVRKIAPDGFVTTLAGSGASGFDNGPGDTATFGDPEGIAVNNDGSEIYVSDLSNHAVRKLTAAQMIYGTPQQAEGGNQSVVLQVSDGTRATTQPFTIGIRGENHAPVADSQSLTNFKNFAIDVVLTGSDSDGDPLTFVVDGTPANGVLTGTPPNLTYTPTSNFIGLDSFTFYVTDGIANSSPATISLTILPPIPPTIRCPDPVTVQCAGAVPAPDTNSVVAGGGCGSVTVEWLGDSISNSNCANQFIITRTYRATDGCGTSNTCTQMITVADTQPPTVAQDQGANAVLECPAAPVFMAPLFADNCGYTVSSNFVQTGTGCRQTNTVTWTATDGCGLSTSRTQVIVVLDTTAPSLTGPNPVTVDCFGDIPAPNTNSVTAIDNCSGSRLVSFVSDSYVTNGSVITVTRTYRASDACGNSGTATHKIYVHDTTPSNVKYKNITVDLDSTGHASITASQIDDGSSDACGSVTLAIDKSTFDCSNLGANTVKLTVTDAGGNSTSGNATVTVQDKLAPILTCPPNRTVRVNLDCSTNVVVETATARDNCDPSPTIQWERSDGTATLDAAYPCPTGAGSKVTTITWRAYDGSGNTNTSTQTITVINTAPNLTPETDVTIVNYGAVLADGVVVITATDAETGGAGLAAPTTEYKAPGSASFVAGLPGSLSLGLPLTGPSATSWSISGTLNAPALGIYEIRVKVKDACGAEGSTTFKIDVRTSCVGSLGDKPMYVGQTYVVADVNGSAKIALSAGLKACEPGADIRLAKVTFAIRNADGTCTPLPGAANLPVGLVDPGNLQCGTATTIVTYNLGKNVASACIQIAILVGGNFVHNIPADDELVTIAMPVQKSSILGCGKIPNCDTNGVNTTRGVLKGVDGDNTKVFFNLTYTKSGSNPQGKVTLLVHSKKNPDGISPDFAEPHCYKITSTAIASLTVNGTNSAATGKALFTSKCTVQDITNPNSLPISLDGSATLQVTATDGTPNLTPPYPGKDDYVSVYVIGKSGGVWFANKLNAKLQAVETPVIANSGDVVVK